MIRRLGLNTEFGADLAVDSDSTGGNQLVAMSTGPQPGGGEEAV
jgi:hypothetical protein